MYGIMIAGGDIHAETATVLFGPEFTKEQRQDAKTINFAMQYGAGVKELALQLNCTEDRAYDLRTRHRQAYAATADFPGRVQARASSRQYVKMWNGRRCRYPKRAAEHTYMAISHLIQGGVAEMVKLAMLRIDDMLGERGWGEVVFQMHDEIICSVLEQHAGEAAVLIKQLGEDFSFDPPPVLEVAVGTTWAGKLRIA